jgi:hypothetical protein
MKEEDRKFLFDTLKAAESLFKGLTEVKGSSAEAKEFNSGEEIQDRIRKMEQAYQAEHKVSVEKARLDLLKTPEYRKLTNEWMKK